MWNKVQNYCGVRMNPRKVPANNCGYVTNLGRHF